MARKPKSVVKTEDGWPREASARDKHLTEKGAEKPNPVPLAPPIGYKKQPSLAMQMREIIRDEAFRRSVQQEGYESFEEADDFDVDDDFDPRTPYEQEFEGIETIETRHPSIVEQEIAASIERDISQGFSGAALDGHQPRSQSKQGAAAPAAAPMEAPTSEEAQHAASILARWGRRSSPTTPSGE